jgi:hypothetical protein
MLTYDHQVIDSTGVFLIGELERLDQTLHMPLYSVTWSRDITLRNDVSIADEVSSFTNSSFAAPGGPSPTGKAFIGKDATAIQGVQLDIGKTAHPLTLWGMQLGWTLPELESAQKLGRPVDAQKYQGMQLKYNMDLDEMVYIGDAGIDATGLLNDPDVKVSNAPNGAWAATTDPDNILADVNTLIESVWAQTAYAICPRRLLLPPKQYGVLVTQKVSSAGNISTLNYLRQNSLANAINGVPLDIAPLKWLTGRGAAGADRMLAYTNDMNYVRYPLVPLQRTPLEYRDLRQLTTYFGRFGQLEVVYQETLGAADGI